MSSANTTTTKNPEITDISGVVNIIQLCKETAYSKYIKPIPRNRTIEFAAFEHKGYFTCIADIVLDKEVNSRGEKKRQTLIKLDNFVKEMIEGKKEWIYIICINGLIVKIGGTRNGFKERFGSYLCGHHITERNKSGKASETNKYVYNTLYFYLEMGCEVKVYGYELPVYEMKVDMWGDEEIIKTQTFHSYESSIINKFKKQTGFIPFLCDNSDPEYRE